MLNIRDVQIYIDLNPTILIIVLDTNGLNSN